MAEIMLVLNHDEIRKQIPYQVVCEAHEGARWNTGKRRRLMREQFTPAEREAAGRLFRQSRLWTLVTGMPRSLKMNFRTYALWQKLGAFCASL